MTKHLTDFENFYKQKTPEILEAITPVVGALESLGISYYVGGSLASSAYGIARATLDVDIVADLKPKHVIAHKDDG